MNTEDSQTPAMKQGQLAGMVTVPFAKSFTYSNGSALATSAMDVRITFAEIFPDLTVEARVGIVMSPEHAVQLVMNLMQQMVVFEKRLGPIRNNDWQAFKTRAETEMGKEVEASPAPIQPTNE
jgi:hypothetical protein